MMLTTPLPVTGLAPHAHALLLPTGPRKPYVRSQGLFAPDRRSRDKHVRRSPEYERALTGATDELRRGIRRLEWLRGLRERLNARGVAAQAHERIVASLMPQLFEALDEKEDEESAEKRDHRDRQLGRVLGIAEFDLATPRQRGITALDVLGGADAPIVCIWDELRGPVAAGTISAIERSLGPEASARIVRRMASEEIVFPRFLQFCFNRDGDLELQTHEIEVVEGFVELLRRRGDPNTQDA